GTDSVGRPRVEPALEEVLERNPLVVHVQLAAPGTEAQELLEVVKTRGQAVRHDHHGPGHKQDDARREDGLVPATWTVTSEDEAGEPDQLVDQRERNNRGKANDFVDQDRGWGAMSRLGGFRRRLDRHGYARRLPTVSSAGGPLPDSSPSGRDSS